MSLAQRFSSVFETRAARSALEKLAAAQHTRLPTFNLTTTSLRHIPKWLDRLRDINNGITTGHGNFYSDPAVIGLVDNAVRPRALTPAGAAFLGKRASIGGSPERGEYELLKILYFGGHPHQAAVQQFLESKRRHMVLVLSQFSPAPIRHLFLHHPKLLVIAELIAEFPGAIPRLLQFSEADLLALINLGESGFANLCSGAGFPRGLARLCRRIGSDYTRGEARRLHYIVSMALGSTAQSVPTNTSLPLQVPSPFSSLLTELDIYQLHARYTSDLAIWFDGVSFQIVASASPPAGVAPAVPPPLPALGVQLLINIPAGIATAASTASRRNYHRSARNLRTSVIIDPVISQKAEDVVEALLRSQYEQRLVRVGHRSGETLALPDGMVPGSDFYVVDATGTPIEFIEVKSIGADPPVDISLTRAEYLRAVRCAAGGTPYRLFLVDARTRQPREVMNFAAGIAAARLEHVRQFVIAIT